jgi:Arc/MetJ-type ribon-helix-helix transcriptional regulator
MPCDKIWRKKEFAMSRADDMTVRLPPHLREAVSDRVRSGQFANENDVIVSSIQALVDDDAEIERWLRHSVAPTYDKVVAGEATLTADEVARNLTAHIDRRKAEKTDR